MHEFSVAEAIIEKTLEIADQKEAKSIKKITIKKGELAHINKDQLIFCINVIKEDIELLNEVEIKIKNVNVSINCSCGYKGEVEPKEHLTDIIMALNCPECEKPDPDIEKGREITIENIEIQK
ncbi:hydrogenase/urease maturation nickel metallochaperone HypA [Methanonatronarchaeum sp. AMET-Sl]|uniref:hydrogenase/urease maturation nickel metallochaperone HypA n=1 Tax=Methanonatronarchaeum sp. AMET-Sl TaxID=3037654 RepID=UPI00244DA527|nr:hydrogenase/urease maturation nickel metallochaperone HypA [Methanonatronarchaeum sp. AMET-Sl]WGI17277.1 hydrogenase/urease maturation nickel metallochaperone HypA [Methanonatronarchaeum sp. AMET-Sl]